MQKKGELIFVIGVIVVFLLTAIAFGFSGVKNTQLSYVKLEINPKVEFVLNKQNKVASVCAINSEARQVLINEQFEGLGLTDAVTKFLTIATNMGFVDVERSDNAVKLTCVSGLTKLAEVKLYQTVNSYFVNNKILGVIIENTSDLKCFKQAKQLGVSVDKFALVESAARLNNLNEKQLCKLSEKQLIKMIYDSHKGMENTANNFAFDELENKKELIKLNQTKINNHKQTISNKAISQFKADYVKNQKQNKAKFQKDFDKQVESRKNRLENTQFAWYLIANGSFLSNWL